MNAIQLFISKLLEDGQERFAAPKSSRPHEPTRQRCYGNRGRGFTNNHGKGESKTRRKIAAKSRRINRKQAK